MNFIQSISKRTLTFGITLVAILLISAVALGNNLTTFNNSEIIAQANPLSQSQSPEAILTVELNSPTNPILLLGTSAGSLKRLSTQGNYKIESLSSVIDFDGTKQTFTLSNSTSMSNNDFLKEFSKSKIAFVKTLINFKTTNNSEKEVAKPLLTKLSLTSIKNADSKISKETTTITGYTVSGSMSSLSTLKSNAKSKNSSIINLEEQKKSIEIIKAKTDSIKDETLKQKVISEEIQKSMPEDVKNQLASGPKLDLTETQIKEVDKLVKKDLSGNNFVDSNEIKTKVKLTDEQTKQVQVAMKSYNDMPTELKDGTSQATSKILETNTQKLLTKDQASTAEKVLSYIADFGGVKASAWTYYGQAGMQMYVEWWGWGTYIPGYTIAEIEWVFGNLTINAFINFLFYNVSAKCGPYTGYCWAAIVIFYFSYGWVTGYNRYSCGSRGVTIWKSFYNAAYTNLTC
jgi:hypothetical protein